eukprot:c20223_g1_i1 orf=169-780(-)
MFIVSCRDDRGGAGDVELRVAMLLSPGFSPVATLPCLPLSLGGSRSSLPCCLALFLQPMSLCAGDYGGSSCTLVWWKQSLLVVGRGCIFVFGAFLCTASFLASFEGFIGSSLALARSYGVGLFAGDLSSWLSSWQLHVVCSWGSPGSFVGGLFTLTSLLLVGGWFGGQLVIVGLSMVLHFEIYVERGLLAELPLFWLSWCFPV